VNVVVKKSLCSCLYICFPFSGQSIRRLVGTKTGLGGILAVRGGGCGWLGEVVTGLGQAFAFVGLFVLDRIRKWKNEICAAGAV